MNILSGWADRNLPTSGSNWLTAESDLLMVGSPLIAPTEPNDFKAFRDVSEWVHWIFCREGNKEFDAENDNFESYSPFEERARF